MVPYYPLLSFLSNSIAPHAQRHHHLFTIYPIGSTLKFCFLARRTLIYRSLVLVVLITGIYIDNRRSSLNTNTTNTVGTRVHTQQQSIIQSNKNEINITPPNNHNHPLPSYTNHIPLYPHGRPILGPFHQPPIRL